MVYDRNPLAKPAWCVRNVLSPQGRTPIPPPLEEGEGWKAEIPVLVHGPESLKKPARKCNDGTRKENRRKSKRSVGLKRALPNIPGLSAFFKNIYREHETRLNPHETSCTTLTPSKQELNTALSGIAVVSHATLAGRRCFGGACKKGTRGEDEMRHTKKKKENEQTAHSKDLPAESTGGLRAAGARKEKAAPETHQPSELLSRQHRAPLTNPRRRFQGQRLSPSREHQTPMRTVLDRQR